MTMSLTQSIITIAIIVAATMLTRFLPFLIFPEGRTPPKFITHLGKVLPPAVIAFLVVYCFKDAVFSPWHALPELIGCAVVAGTYLWKHNMLISIGSGTVLYMVLVQLVFK